MAPEFDDPTTVTAESQIGYVGLPRGGKPDFGLRPKPDSEQPRVPKRVEFQAIEKFLEGQPSQETFLDFRKAIAVKLELLKSELKKLQELKELDKEVTIRIKSSKLDESFIYADINIIPEKDRQLYPKILVFDYAYHTDDEKEAERKARRHQRLTKAEKRLLESFPFPKPKFDYWDKIQVTLVEQMRDGDDIKDLAWLYDYEQKPSRKDTNTNTKIKVMRCTSPSLMATEEELLKLTRKIESPSVSIEPIDHSLKIAEEITNEAIAQVSEEEGNTYYTVYITRWKLGII